MQALLQAHQSLYVSARRQTQITHLTESSHAAAAGTLPKHKECDQQQNSV